MGTIFKFIFNSVLFVFKVFFAIILAAFISTDV